MKKLEEKNPNRYYLGSDNKWHCPPAQAYAERLGFSFRVWSDDEINWTLQRNISFLEDFYACYLDDEAAEFLVEKSAENTILSLVSAQPGMSLSQLLHHAQGTEPDDIYFLIAAEKIYVDLMATPLVEPERCFVFRDRQTASAYKAMLFSQTNTDSISSPIVDLSPGKSVCWDGKAMKIIFVGETEVLLQGEGNFHGRVELPVFEQLVQAGKIVGVKVQPQDNLSSEAMELLLKASETDLKEANRRYRCIEPRLRGEPFEEGSVPQRTLRYWYAKYCQAQQRYGYGFVGLLSFDSLKGNSNPKLPKHLTDQIERFIEEKYETHKQMGKGHVYGLFVDSCIADGIPEEQVPSYKTFLRKLKQRSGYEQTRKREGSRAAYSQEPFYLELELTTPRHGDRSFEIGHIDHTQLDVELRCSSTGKNLGRPWATFLVDAYDRRILAVYITFDAPSYRSCMMALRICVKRFGRLPKIIVTDNGSEFHSIYFETLLALFGCIHKYRPPAKARFNAVGERLFGTSATQLIHNLAGNTQITKRVRLVTNSVNPKNLALWTLGLLYSYLCEWAYEIYETTEHPTIGCSPRDAFFSSLAQHGSRSHRLIPYDEHFRKLTLPTTPQGKAKVQPNYGIKINHIYYWSNAFRDPELEKTWVDVRYDPFDAGVAYAHVKGQWLECHSEHYSVLKGRSEKEIQLASAELRERHRNHAKNFKLRAKNLGAFLSSVEAEEALLTQRLRDAQLKDVFEVMEGGRINRDPYVHTKHEENSFNSGNYSTEMNSKPNLAEIENQEELGFYEEY